MILFLNSLPGEFGRHVALDFVAVARECSAVFDAGGGLACACDGGVVEAAACVLSNLSKLGEALEAGLEADRAARHVDPADGVFEHPKPCAVGDEEQFNVEAEAVYERALNYRAAHVHAEGFEAALRVLEGHARQDAHHAVEDATALLARPGLVRADEPPVERARAEHDVVLPRPYRLAGLGRLCFPPRNGCVAEQADRVSV